MIEIVTNPDSFFRKRSENPKFLYPLLIVFTVAVLNIISSLINAQPLIQMYGSGQSSLAAMVSVFGGFLTAGITIGFWIIFSGLFYMISGVFENEGTFKDLVKLCGWGYLPDVLLSLITIAISYIVIQSVVVPQDLQMIQEFSRQVQAHPLSKAEGVISIVFIVWRGTLWSFAVKHVRGLSTRQALLTISVPVLANIAISLLALL